MEFAAGRMSKMNPRLCLSVLLTIALVWTSVPASAAERFAPYPIREFVEAARATSADVTVELENGTIVRGQVGATNRRRFYVLDGTRAGQAIAYARTRAFIDPASGERLMVQAPGPSSHMPGMHTSLKKLLVVGVVVGAFIVWVFATGLNRA
jgi:hypothetical protein